MKKLLSIALLTSLGFAIEFQPLGFKSIGMGGAGVATASGSNAAYYNPALLAFHNYDAEFNLEMGIGVREINLVDPLDKIVNTYKLSDTIDTIENHAPFSGTNSKQTRDNIQGALKEIYKLSLGNGAEIEPTASFSAQIENFALGVYGLGEIESNAVINRQHLYLIFQDKKEGGYYYYYPKTDTYGATDKKTYENYSLEYALNNNLTYIRVKGLGIAEVPLSYAHKFSIKNADLSIGINLKYMEGITYSNILSLENTDSDKLNDSLDNNKKVSSAIGVDLGFLLRADKIKFGLVGKNLNSPKFDFYDGSKYTLSPMYRGGVAVNLNSWITFAMDIDLSQNNTFIPGYKSQYVGGGFDIHPGSWISLRAGLKRNMLQDEEGNIITGGFGLGLKWFQLDLAGEASTKSGTYEGASIPHYFKVNLALLSRWGN